TAPASLRGVARRFADRGHAEDGDALAALQKLRARDESERDAAQSPHGLLIAGCESLSAGGATAGDALLAARAMGAPPSLAPDGALCCGRKLIEAGFADAFKAHAARVCDALHGAGSAALHLVFLQPACARTVRERYPAQKAVLPPGTAVEHVTTFLSRAL